MKEKFKGYDEEATITHNAGVWAKEKLYAVVLAFLKEHDCYSMETYMQCDAPQLAMPDLMEKILEDVFEFDVEWD